MACEFNKMVDCNSEECKNCGWNPVVAEKRIDKICKERQALCEVKANEAMDR